MTKIIEFANKHSISWRPIKLEITNVNGKVKKIPLPIQITRIFIMKIG